jgi:large subunit ribosomal protein L2
MPTTTFRPLTPVLRYKMVADRGNISTGTPYKPLLVAIGRRRGSGRNAEGHMTVRHRGGGQKRFYRIVDFRRDKFGIPGIVEAVEYDPNRTCHIALVKYSDGERRYILATVNMKVGTTVLSADQCDMAEGNCMQLKHVQPGTMVHNVEMREGRGGQIVRTAGSYAEVLAKENNMVQLKLPSTEIRSFRETCRVTIGQVSNPEHMNVILGSAGRNRWLGHRPRTRAVAMNPVDHPMGGGEGKSKGGRHPCSPRGQKAKGLKTRHKKNVSSRYIVSRRTQKTQ